MKKFYLFVLLMWLHTGLAQTVTSITYTPANPTVSDSIQFIIQCDFPYTACDGTGYLDPPTSNQISAGGLHCMGMFAALCTDYDTIVVPPQAAGVYSFTYILATGQQPLCVPGIFPLAVDSVSFTVSPSTGIPIIEKNHFTLSPNPSDGLFVLDMKEDGEGATLKIFSAQGSLLLTRQIDKGANRLNTGLAPGLYFLMVEQGNERKYMTKLLITGR